eukprot:CAMPEP_0202906830 /NCGR_PEP_ID=MMETSP1392-20130828/40435_1 /ASSEMBLY_ACC=CAM_ASM_000868 /TAXON_ID=225041 /ORGANISM="Chlamydomonas chlamydogama, Strain SAG 11-48b" /LENGTH=80 /DNA_ID=CAMNT_0049595495 /DNA_START=418 /DNA_END=660 /DNA_ORIENTATION=+
MAPAAPAQPCDMLQLSCSSWPVTHTTAIPALPPAKGFWVHVLLELPPSTLPYYGYRVPAACATAPRAAAAAAAPAPAARL